MEVLPLMMALFLNQGQGQNYNLSVCPPSKRQGQNCNLSFCPWGQN